MKSCRFTRTSRFLRWCAACFYPTVSALILAACITFILPAFRHELEHPLLLIVMFIAGTVGAWFMLRYGLRSYKFESRKYSISKSGIEISSRRKQVHFVPWEEIEEICIAVFSTTSALQSYQEVICIFITPREPNFLRKMARGYYYAVRNFDHFIVIDFTKDELNTLCGVYPGNIADYRNDQIRKYSLN